MKLDIQEIACHRNGVGGLGFYAIRFRWQPDDVETPENFIATVFDKPGACAVISLDRIEANGVRFGGGNSWRGDTFEPHLRKAINDADSLSGAGKVTVTGGPLAGKKFVITTISELHAKSRAEAISLAQRKANDWRRPYAVLRCTHPGNEWKHEVQPWDDRPSPSGWRLVDVFRPDGGAS